MCVYRAKEQVRFFFALPSAKKKKAIALLGNLLKVVHPPHKQKNI
jgi:hypothetical protein